MAPRYHCPTCDRDFETQEQLDEHLQFEHNATQVPDEETAARTEDSAALPESATPELGGIEAEAPTIRSE